MTTTLEVPADDPRLLALQVALLAEMIPSPGMTDSVCSVFLATNCTPTERQLHGPEEQHSVVLHVPLADALAMVERGEIADAKTVAGLLLTERRLRGS